MGAVRFFSYLRVDLDAHAYPYDLHDAFDLFRIWIGCQYFLCNVLSFDLYMYVLNQKDQC